MSEGEFVDVRPYLPVKRGPSDIDESTRHLRHHRVAAEARPESQRARGHVGHLLSGLLRGHGSARRASRAQGRLAAGADRRLVHRRRLAPQRRALPAALFTSGFFGRRSRNRPGTGANSSTARRTATTSSSAWGRLPSRRQLLQRKDRLLERADAPRHIRRVLESAKPSAPPEEHQAGDDDRGRLVRRRGPLRRAERLRLGGAAEPRRVQHAGDGSVVSRRMGAFRWRRIGRCALRIENVALLPREHRASVLQLLPEGQRRVEAAGGLRFRNRPQSVAPLRHLAARRKPPRSRSTCTRAGSCHSNRRPKHRPRSTST